MSERTAAGPVGGARRERLLGRLVTIAPAERGPTLLAGAYFFCSLASWFVLRPIRDEIAVAAGVRTLPWFFAATLVVTLVTNALYSALVARLPVRRLLLVTYQALVACLVLFWLAWRGPEGTPGAVWAGRLFFAWTTMFAVLVPSLFWSVMADAYRSGQAARLFGVIGVGGTLGSIAGSALTATLARVLGTSNLLLVSVVLLEGAALLALAFQARRGVLRAVADGAVDGAVDGDATRAAIRDAVPVRGRGAAARVADADARAIGGSVWAGATHVARNPYLLGIAGFLLLYNTGSTVLYFAQTEIVGAAYATRDARTEVLARVEFLTQLLTVVTQALLTGRVIRRFGLATTLALMPALSIVGFGVIGLSAWGLVPALGGVLAFTVLRRAANFALTNPAMEALFTVVTREDKYKAKVFLETFVYRAADQLAAWGYAGLAAVGLTFVGISWVTVPLSAVFLVLALWLGRRHRVLAAAERGALGDPSGRAADAPPASRAPGALPASAAVPRA